MKCYFHETLDAVSTCQHCGKGLCKECASRYIPCLCEECAALRERSAEQEKNQRKQDALIDTNRELIFAVLKGLACSVALTLLFNALAPDRPTPFGISVMLFFVPFGWAVITYLEQWLPVIFMSGILYVVYLIIKLTVSMLLGVPCFIFQIVKYIVNMVSASRIR